MICDPPKKINFDTPNQSDQKHHDATQGALSSVSEINLKPALKVAVNRRYSTDPSTIDIDGVGMLYSLLMFLVLFYFTNYYNHC